MTEKEIIELINNLAPLEAPKIKVDVEKSCHNCQDYIVCYGLEEKIEIDKGANCSNWKLDFMTFQEMLEVKE